MYNRTQKGLKPSSSNFRIVILLVVMIGIFIVIEVRLFQIQVLAHKKYNKEAQGQYSDLTVLQPKRGDIISSDNYTLAGNQTEYLLFVEPSGIKDKDTYAKNLALELTELTYKESSTSQTKESVLSSLYDFIFKAVNRDLLWVPIQKGITPPQRKVLEEKHLPFIGFEDQPVRFYPEGTLASHVLGFVASNEGGEKVGYYGIEGSLNNELKGKNGKISEEKDAAGIPMLIGSYKKLEPVQGRSIVLSINRAIQYTVEKKLKEGVEKFDAVSGSVIVMEPFTGDIVAMANFPTYDPSDFSDEGGLKQPLDRRKSIERKNLSISNTYEPGSVIKPLTISAAIEKKLVTPETTYEDNGPVRYSDYYIDNWDGVHYGALNIIQLLQKSNNIGAAWVGHLVGKDRLFEFFKSYGLGVRTGVELEGEDSGVLRAVKGWTDIDTATASFGQGLSATPLQVLNAFNVFANGGYLLQPKIMQKIVDGKKEITLPTKNLKRVISKETSLTMVDLLEKAAEGGEAKYFTLKDYRIAGKTGTAQIPEEGKYSPDRTNATFVGFMAGSKKFSMIVRLEEPKTSIYAAETAVPLWMEIASELVKYYGLPPDRVQQP